MSKQARTQRNRLSEGTVSVSSVSSHCFFSRLNGRRKYLQFVALDGLLLGRLLHKVRDEDFQCGSSFGVQRRRERMRAAAGGIQVTPLMSLTSCKCAHLPALFFASFLLLAVPVP